MENLEIYFVVGLLSLIIGWFTSREFFRQKDINNLKSLHSIINEKEICLKNLELDCSKKQNKLDRLIDESIICKHELLQKSNLLRKKSDELYKIQKELNIIRDKISKVETVTNKKLENESIIRNNKSNDAQELQRLRTIIIKKDKLIENRKKNSSSYFEISKDQFKQIEKRLKEYKEKADRLEEENTRLVLLNSSKKEFSFFKKINYSISNIKDVALSNLFREKLTKA